MNLLLMRHSKSSMDNPDGKDFDRPLVEQGKKDACIMGEFLKDCGYRPDLIISSSAKRAMQTTQLVSDAAGIDPGLIQFDDEFYFSSLDAYVNAIHRTDAAIGNLMLVGHNPLMEHLLSHLTVGRDSGTFIFSTSDIACVEIIAPAWKDVRKGNNRLKWFMTSQILSGSGR
jgi:phosphohistidine phosphatase